MKKVLPVFKEKLHKFDSAYLLLLSILVFLLLFGIYNLGNYGIHVDDFSLARYGELVSLHLVDPGNTAYLTEGFMRYYSPLFEVVSHLSISYFGFAIETLAYYQIRKLIIYLSFLVGLTFYYLLLRKFFSTRVTLLSTASLYLIPSFFGYASITSKEIPLLSFTIVSIFFLISYLKNNKFEYLLFHGIFYGIAIAIRPSVLTLLPISIIFIGIANVKIRNLNKKVVTLVLSKNILAILAFLVISVIPSLILDPYLHQDTFARYISRLDFMSHFDMGGSILIQGEVIKIADSKSIDMFLLGVRKIPEIFLLLTILGIVVSGYSLIRQRHEKSLLFVVAGLWFVLPFLAIIINETKFYNFRHLLIFLPPLGIFAAGGIDFLVNHKNILVAKIGLIIVVLGIILSMLNIYKLFPYEIIYFNQLSGGIAHNSKLYTNYPEGLAESEAITKLCNTQPEQFKLSGPFVRMYIPYYCPDKALYEEDYAKSDFILTYDFYEKLAPIPDEAVLVDTIERDNANILSTYSLK